MPIYFYWGEDDFRLTQAVSELRDRTLDPAWASFNFDKIPADQADSVMTALNQAMTPPFGLGQRLVWLQDTSLFQRCSAEVLKELERTLPNLPDTTVLLFTSTSKPDGRLKSTKLMQRHSTVKDFSAIPPWKTDLIAKQVKDMAAAAQLTLTSGAAERLAEAVGNQTRQLHTELEKLALYRPGQPIDVEAVDSLVSRTTQNSLQLADALRQGKTASALALGHDLLLHNEPALRIVATLVGKFRSWLWVKLMMELGERDERAIAQAADISNPKRVYFVQKEVRSLSLKALQQTLPLLLDLEAGLKRGADEQSLLQTKLIEISLLFR